MRAGIEEDQLVDAPITNETHLLRTGLHMECTTGANIVVCFPSVMRQMSVVGRAVEMYHAPKS